MTNPIEEPDSLLRVSTRQEQVDGIKEIIKLLGGVEMLAPLVPRAAQLRAAGIRIILNPVTFEALMKMGDVGKSIAVNSWIVEHEVVYNHWEWSNRAHKIASGELGPQGQKPGAFKVLLRRLNRLTKSFFSFGTKLV